MSPLFFLRLSAAGAGRRERERFDGDFAVIGIDRQLVTGKVLGIGLAD